MPELFLRAKDSGLSLKTWLIKGYWIDVGRLDSYEIANTIFKY